MDGIGSLAVGPVAETGGGGAHAAPPHRTPLLVGAGSGTGDLPPLCNTGGNSPSEDGKPAWEQPGKLGIGWLKIRHTRKSYAVWSFYRVNSMLANGAEPCAASKQHRAFGVRLFWGGYEYWGWKAQRNESDAGDDQGMQSDYLLDRTPEQVEELRAISPSLRLPDGDSVLTEWSDDALHTLEIYLRWHYGQCLLSLLGELLAAGASVTRLDISADFAATSIDPVVSSMEAKDYSPMRVHEFHDSRGKGPTGGRTCYFGRRGQDGGGVFIRFYEKGREQGLPIELLRYEVELSGDKARDAARKLADAPEAWSPVGASILAGAIDFRDGYGALRGAAHAARDSQRAVWWSGLVNRLAAGVKLERVKRPDATLPSMKQWAEDSWGRAAAMMKAWMGAGRFAVWLNNIIDAGAERLTERDLAILRDAQTCEVPF